jgi:hypothetical protein
MLDIQSHLPGIPEFPFSSHTNRAMLDIPKFSPNIFQRDQNELVFFSWHRDPILKWLMNDCVWSYHFFSEFTCFASGRLSYLIFDDNRALIEFKLRFG